MVRKYKARALRDYFRLNEQIHQLILAAARNPTLSQMQLGLAGRVRRARYMANMSPARWAKAVAEHEKILEALAARSEEHTSELQSLMRISYAVFCLKKNKTRNKNTKHPVHA